MRADVELFAQLEGCPLEASRQHLEAHPQLRLPDEVAAAVAVATQQAGAWSAPSQLAPTLSRLLTDLGPRAADLEVHDLSDQLSMTDRLLVTDGSGHGPGVDFARQDVEFLFVGACHRFDEVLFARTVRPDDRANGADPDGDELLGEPYRSRVLGSVLWLVSLFALTRDLQILRADLPVLGPVETFDTAAN